MNQDYAKRFEHNKKRDELMRCMCRHLVVLKYISLLTYLVEEKYGNSRKRSAEAANPAPSGDDTDSTSETEDEGELATAELDNEISATLSAIRSKDPRVYDKSYTFYKEGDAEPAESGLPSREKSLSLQQYHRQNLMNGGAEPEQDDTPMSHAQEQEKMKMDVVRQIHEAAQDDESDGSGSDGDEVLFKAKPRVRAERPTVELPSVTGAEENPEAFLNEFVTSRAWVPQQGTTMQPFESDDEEDEEQADNFEQAYNMRFENPDLSNAALRAHSRTAAADHSVRREQAKGRKKAREIEKAARDAARQEREEEKARLRNLRVEQMQQKFKQFKEAAGLKDKELAPDEWNEFLEAAFDSDKWEEEMKKRFDDKYYARKRGKKLQGHELEGASEDDETNKPAWTNDVDITDIVPDFDDGDDADFSLSEDEQMQDVEDDEAEDGPVDARLHNWRKRKYRKERQEIEEVVQVRQALEDAVNGTYTPDKPAGGFRYRETSPTSYGLTAQDILLTDDRNLNTYHGLKKLATFRDMTKKAKDKKKLDKKRLQNWRYETFGHRHGPRATFRDYVQGKLEGRPSLNGAISASNLEPIQTKAAKSTKKRKRKHKGAEKSSEA